MADHLQSDTAAWNFFHRQAEPDLWCAVPMSSEVPAFVMSGEWAFIGERLDSFGFDVSVAAHSERLNGFYLFHRIVSQGAA